MILIAQVVVFPNTRKNYYIFSNTHKPKLMGILFLSDVVA
ncbi:hypothetical protein RMAECT_0434 [Rickettsia rhipicephali str. Ect]|uniref:Uncharacterized protein n=1 Tax=Rickettsia rhipicephali str. Ect TaxID=1359199 RepID=A0A0F3PFW5_RICRH|nr:hypothetical protein RMAECT_0434 [Rickettsia rhipicephali str. Ect]